MKCPVCREPDLLMAERQGVEIDYCPSCRGIWLDRGELDKILDRLQADAGGGPRDQAPPPDKHGHDDHHSDQREHSHESSSKHKKKSKSSFIMDVFEGFGG